MSLSRTNVWTECCERVRKLHSKQKMVRLVCIEPQRMGKKRTTDERRVLSRGDRGGRRMFFLLFFLPHMLRAVALTQSDTTE